MISLLKSILAWFSPCRIFEPTSADVILALRIAAGQVDRKRARR